MSATTTTDMNPDAFCTSKRAFGTFQQASEAASKTSHNRSIRCHPYRCTRCGMYHYGQADGRTPRQQMQRRRQRNFEKEDEV